MLSSIADRYPDPIEKEEFGGHHRVHHLWRYIQYVPLRTQKKRLNRGKRGRGPRNKRTVFGALICLHGSLNKINTVLLTINIVMVSVFFGPEL